jgi:hypothetical protein
VSRFPVAFRPPAFASRSSCSRRGVGPSLRSAYRPRPRAHPDLDGVTAFRTRELRPGWVPPLPRGRRCSPGQVVSLTGACRSATASPCTPPHFPSTGFCFTRHQRGFTQFTRPVFPSPVAARMERAPLGFPPSFAPRRLSTGDARRGGDRPSSTGLELRAQHHIRRSSNPCSSLTTCDLASHDEIQASAGARSALAPLLHLSQSSSDAATAPFHAAGHSRHPGGRGAMGYRFRPGDPDWD